MQHGLLDETVHYGWDAKLTHPTVGFGNLHPSHRHRPVRSAQQLILNPRPVNLQVFCEVANGHTVHTRGTFVGSYSPLGGCHVLGTTYHLHDRLGR